MTALNETHDPALRSWVRSANRDGTDFPLQNLPFGVFRRAGAGEAFRGGVAIGDQVLDLAAAARAGVFAGEAEQVARTAGHDTLNALMAMGPAAWSALRLALSRALREGGPSTLLQRCLLGQAEAEFALPSRVGDYTDFFTSIDHATNAGRITRPGAPLTPNYRWVPIGYHGRASSIVVSGRDVVRPLGQVLPAPDAEPVLRASRQLDFELELGVFVGPGNAQGTRIPMAAAEDHVFGICLLNDWSARDIQRWESQPLGPFLAKNFATSISPWIVTLEALAPYRVPLERADGGPHPLAYLDSAGNRERGAVDLQLALELQTPRMREAGLPGECMVRTNYRHAYWTFAQMVAHHTVGGCNLNPGDLLGTGTMSGPTPASAGAMLELTAGGSRPLTLGNGEVRAWLEDGDSVTIRGWCERAGAARIGFGACAGAILPVDAGD